MNFAERIAELQGQLATANETLVAAQAQAQQNFTDLTAANVATTAVTVERDAAQADLLAVTGERDVAVAALPTITGERDTAVTALATEQTNRETLVFDQVNVRLGAAGVAPIKRDASGAETPAGKGVAKTGTPRERLASNYTIAGQS